MLSPDDIKNTVALGEGYNAEFKVRVPNKVKDLTEEVCAFANAAGGVILVGVDDSNVIQGASINNSKRSSIQNSISEISPSLPCQFYIVNVDERDIGVIEVPSGPNKPYVLSGAIYVRIGPNTQKLTSVEEMRDFFQQADRIYFDEVPCKGFDHGAEIDTDNLVVFRSESGISSGIEDEQVFTNLRLYSADGAFKNGAVLFFGKSPEQYFEKAVIRCVEFDGIDKRFIKDDKTMAGALYQQYLQAIDWIKGKIDVRYDIEASGTGPRNEIWEIPKTIFKESIINALSHRDYYDRGGRITLEVFDDRVEISNPGGLVSAISPREFGKRSHSRNPLIFGLFERMRMVEQIGSGISRMRDLMQEAGLPAPEFSHDGTFSVIFRRPLDFENWINKWENHLTDNRLAILRAIHENSSVSIKELASLIELSSSAIDKNLSYLKDKGVLDRVGTRGGKWVIKFILPT